MNYSHKKDLINSIESRFQALFTISIFFSGGIYYLAKAANQTDGRAAITVLQFGGVIGLLVVDYFIFHIDKDDLSKIWLRKINNGLRWPFLAFAIPILIIAFLATLPSTTSILTVHILGITLASFFIIILFIPIIIEFFLILGSIKSIRRKIRK